jgi:hypothetical protein
MVTSDDVAAHNGRCFVYLFVLSAAYVHDVHVRPAMSTGDMMMGVALASGAVKMTYLITDFGALFDYTIDYRKFNRGNHTVDKPLARSQIWRSRLC